MIFRDRNQAGELLAEKVRAHLPSGSKVLVLALPRGGLPVAAPISRALGADLDVLIVRKLGLPWHQELAMGAISSGGGIYLNERVISASLVSDEQLDAVIEIETAELARREALYRGKRGAAPIGGKIVVLVDDGIATGATVKAALLAIRSQSPAAVILAVPVAPFGSDVEFDGLVDEFVCLNTPVNFSGVGQFYESFDQVTDAKAIELLGG